MFVTMQILNLLQANHDEVGGKELSSPYRDFVKAFDFVNLDFIQFVPLNCVYARGFDHGEALLLQASCAEPI